MHEIIPNNRISTSGEKSDVIFVFLNPDFLNDSAIRGHLRQI